MLLPIPDLSALLFLSLASPFKMFSSSPAAPLNVFEHLVFEDTSNVMPRDLAGMGVLQFMSPSTDMEKTNVVTLIVDNSVPDHERVRDVPLQYGPAYPSGLPPASRTQRSDFASGYQPAAPAPRKRTPL